MSRVLVILIAVAAIVSCEPKEEKGALITGEIENPITDELELNYYKDFITYDVERHEIVLDENNNFSLELDIEEPVEAEMIFNDNEPVDIFLEPGDELHITADGSDIVNSISFSGDNADNSTFMVQYQTEILDKYGQQKIIERMRDLEPGEFVDFANEALEDMLQYFNEFSEKKDLSDSFEHIFKTNIRFGLYENLLSYPEFHQMLNQLDEEPELPEDYYAFIEKDFQFYDDKLASSNYCSFLITFLDYYESINPDKAPEDKSAIEEKLYLAEKLYDDKSLEYVKAIHIYREFDHGEFEVAENLYHSFKEEEPVKDYISILSDNYEAEKRMLPGNPAPEFELEDIDGNKVSLEDFRGKVVYLDFWASWCPPCMREVPYAKELKERFDDVDDLVFLYISVDEDEEAWKSTVDEREIEGVHLNIEGRDNEVSNSYNLGSIPSYLIIDRNGVIFDNNAKRPSHEGIDEDLKEALEKHV